MLICALADTNNMGRLDANMLTQQQMMELFFTPSDCNTA